MLAPLTTALSLGPGGLGPQSLQLLVMLILVAVATGPLRRAGRPG